MKAICFMAILVVAFAGRATAGPLILKNVTVLDMNSERVLSGIMVRIDDGIIQNIGPAGSRPEDAEGSVVVDAEGKFLIPGLWDMHAHFSYYGEEALGLLVGHGVLGARDPGCNLDQIDQWRDEIARGERIGPRIIRSGPFIDGPKALSPLRASFTRVVRTETEGRAVVRELKERGVDFLKTHSRVPRAAFFGVADEARKLGLPLVVHVSKYVSVWEAVQAGARTIEHTESFLGDSIYLDAEQLMEARMEEAFEVLSTATGKERLAQVAECDTWITPTLIAHVRGYRNHESPFWRAFPDRLLQVLKTMVEVNMPFLAGSDFNFPAGPIRPGADLHAELELFVQAGLTPYEALKTATVNAAEASGLAVSHGTINIGKRADLVLLDANPFEDIGNTRRISAVILGGSFLNEARLLALRGNTQPSN